MLLGIFFILLLLDTGSASPWCPQVTVLSEYIGSFSSPRHTELYPDNLQCTWHIKAPVTLHVRLSFSSFHLEDCGRKCDCDSLTVYDLQENNKSVTSGKFCGTKNPGTLYSSGRSMIVVFKSDHGDSNIGFLANYEIIGQGSVCRSNGQVLNNGGTVSTPNYPNKYPDRTQCTWIINAGDKSRITFKFLNFHIEDCSAVPGRCRCDYVEVRDGNSSSSFLIGKYCGSVTPTELYSSGRHMWVQFVSDRRVSDKGFVAEFSSKQNEECSCPPSWRFPFRCPKKYWELSNNRTSVCCYDNGANCCEQGGKYCTDTGKDERTYCPRPRDETKLTQCCTEKGKPSCCVAKGNSLGINRLLPLLVLLCRYLLWTF